MCEIDNRQARPTQHFAQRRMLEYYNVLAFQWDLGVQRQAKADHRPQLLLDFRIA